MRRVVWRLRVALHRLRDPRGRCVRCVFAARFRECLRKFANVSYSTSVDRDVNETVARTLRSL